MAMLVEREMKLHKVQRLFTSIVDELFVEPLLLAQFIVWLDYKLAEYKFTGNMKMALFADVGANDYSLPVWLKALWSTDKTHASDSDRVMTDTVVEVNQMKNTGTDVEMSNCNTTRTNKFKKHGTEGITNNGSREPPLDNSNSIGKHDAAMATETKLIKGKQIQVIDHTPISIDRKDNESQLLRLELEKGGPSEHIETTSSNRETSGSMTSGKSTSGELSLRNVNIAPIDMTMAPSKATSVIASTTHRAIPVSIASTTHRAIPVSIASTTHRAIPVSIASITHKTIPVSISSTTHRAMPVSIASTTHRATPVSIASTTHRAIPVDIASTTHRAIPVDIASTTHKATPQDTAITNSKSTSTAMSCSKRKPKGIAIANSKATPLGTAIKNNKLKPMGITMTKNKPKPTGIAITNRRIAPATNSSKASAGVGATITHKSMPISRPTTMVTTIMPVIATPTVTIIANDKTMRIGRESVTSNEQLSVKPKRNTTVVIRETDSNATPMSTDLMNIASIDDSHVQLSKSITGSIDGANRKRFNNTADADATVVVETDRLFRKDAMVDKQITDQNTPVENSDSGIFDDLHYQTPTTSPTSSEQRTPIDLSSGKKRKLKSKYRFRKILRATDGTYKLAANNVVREKEDVSSHTPSWPDRYTAKSLATHGQIQQQKGVSTINLKETASDEQERQYVPKSWHRVHSDIPEQTRDTCSYEDENDFHDLCKIDNPTSPCFYSQPFTTEPKLPNTQDKHINISGNNLYTNTSDSLSALLSIDDTSPCKVKIANVFSLRPDQCSQSNSLGDARTPGIGKTSDRTLNTGLKLTNDTISSQNIKPVYSSDTSNATNITSLSVKSNTIARSKDPTSVLTSSAQSNADTCTNSSSVTSYSLCEFFDHVRAVPLYTPDQCTLPSYHGYSSSRIAKLTSSVTDTPIKSATSCDTYNSRFVKNNMLAMHTRSPFYRATSSATVYKDIQPKVALTITSTYVSTSSSNGVLPSTHSHQNKKDLVPTESFTNDATTGLGLAQPLVDCKAVHQKLGYVGTLKTDSNDNSDIQYIPSTVVPCYVSMGKRILQTYHIAGECSTGKTTKYNKNRFALETVSHPIAPKLVPTSDACQRRQPSSSTGLPDIGAQKQGNENEKTVNTFDDTPDNDLHVSEQTISPPGMLEVEIPLKRQTSTVVKMMNEFRELSKKSHWMTHRHTRQLHKWLRIRKSELRPIECIEPVRLGIYLTQFFQEASLKYQMSKLLMMEYSITQYLKTKNYSANPRSILFE